MRPRVPDVRALPWEQARSLLAEAIEDVGQILTGGWRLRDQSGAQLRDVVIDTGATPHASITIDSKGPPVSVELVRAVIVADTTGRAITGGPISWEWRGGVLIIHSASALASTTRYQASILVRE